MLATQKDLFNLPEGLHYFNCAYKAPLLKSSEEAAIKAIQQQRNPSTLYAPDYYDDAEEARTLFGEIVNCQASEVAIMPSTSYGFSSVLNNIYPKDGQHALSIDNDFPSDYFSIKRWCDTHEVAWKVVKPNEELADPAADWNERILEAINEDTAVVIMSSIHWMNGWTFDLEKIGAKCKAVGAKFIVDGTQSVGAMPIDVKKFQIDALICATYKWLFGPYSVVLAYVGEAFNEGIPLEESWMNRINAMDFSNLTVYEPTYKPDAGRYNVGQLSNFILMPILVAALKQLIQWGIPNIQSYCVELTKPLHAYYSEKGVNLTQSSYQAAHLFAIPLLADIEVEVFKQFLFDRGIFLSVRSGNLRISVNVFNTVEDVEALIKALQAKFD